MARLTNTLRAAALEHVAMLARRRDITIRWNVAHEPYALIAERQIGGPPIHTALDYLSMLHEIGHIASRRAQRDHDPRGADEIAVEGAAWAWACDRALPEIVAKMSEADWRELGNKFCSYLRHHALRD